MTRQKNPVSTGSFFLTCSSLCLPSLALLTSPRTFQKLEVGSFSDSPTLWSSHKITWFLGVWSPLSMGWIILQGHHLCFYFGFVAGILFLSLTVAWLWSLHWEWHLSLSARAFGPWQQCQSVPGWWWFIQLPLLPLPRLGQTLSKKQSSIVLVEWDLDLFHSLNNPYLCWLPHPVPL